MQVVKRAVWCVTRWRSSVDRFGVSARMKEEVKLSGYDGRCDTLCRTQINFRPDG